MSVQEKELVKPNQLLLDRVAQELSGIRHAQFSHHGGAVHFDGPDADPKPSSNVLVPKAGPNKSENLVFAVGQLLGSTGRSHIHTRLITAGNSYDGQACIAFKRRSPESFASRVARICALLGPNPNASSYPT